jgi:hypothetical protein
MRAARRRSESEHLDLVAAELRKVHASPTESPPHAEPQRGERQ